MSATRRLRKLFTRLGLEENLGLIGSRAAAGIENDPGVGQLNVARILRLNHSAAKNSDVEVFRFFLIPDDEKMRDEETFL